MKPRRSKGGSATGPRRCRLSGLAVESAIKAARDLEAVWRAASALQTGEDFTGCCRRLRAHGLNSRQAISICKMLGELQRMQMLARRDAIGYSACTGLLDARQLDALTASLDIEQQRIPRIHIVQARSTVLAAITR